MVGVGVIDTGWKGEAGREGNGNGGKDGKGLQKLTMAGREW